MYNLIKKTLRPLKEVIINAFIGESQLELFLWGYKYQCTGGLKVFSLVSILYLLWSFYLDGGYKYQCIPLGIYSIKQPIIDLLGKYQCGLKPYIGL